MASSAPHFSGGEVGRSDFSGGSQAYLRDDQYRDGSKLNARFHLHQAYGTAKESFQSFVSGLIDWTTADSALECGCGNGRFWEDNDARRDIAATLTDLSPGMVTEAVERARTAGFTNVTGRVCDVQRLPFGADSFDVVAANHMLYHAPNPDRAIGELARVLKPDGVFVAATNGYGHMDVIKDVLTGVFAEDVEGLYAVFGIDTGEARLREAFRSVAWHAFDNDLIVTDPDDVIAYITSYPPGEAATPAQSAEIRKDVEARFVRGALRIRTRTGVFVCRMPR
ncbi:MAG: class I SAM-dependent methyltransferase [Acidimicrobiales bacterium]